MMGTIDLVVFISGNGSNLQSIIDAIESGLLDARICAVISNNAEAYGLTRARNHGIDAFVVDHRNHRDRTSYDRALLDEIKQYQPNYIVLAGFMRILGSDFIQPYSNRILNIHPSILPNYKGLNTHKRALENNEQEHGVSIHLVTPELDDGPILYQGRFPIEACDSIEDLQAKGHALEHRMYPTLLQWLSSGDLQIKEESVVYQNQTIHQAIEYESNA